MPLELPPTMLYEKRGHVAVITINRPEKRNSMTPDMFVAFYDIFDDFNNDPDLFVAIITGAGEKAFSSGADLDKTVANVTAGRTRSTAVPADKTKRFLSDIFKPIIAAVNGYAVAGGMEMLLGTDLRVASENATFGLSEVRLALVPGAGSCIRLPRQIPWAVAFEMILSGKPIDAKRAYDVGLVNYVVTGDQLMPKAMELAEAIAKNGPLALRTAKEIMVRSYNLEPWFVMEDSLTDRIRRSEDAREGPRAFMEKREPNYQGR